MNKVILMGRLTRDPDIRSSAGNNPQTFARYTLAVDRRFSRRDGGDNGQSTDFISCVAFGRSAEFAEKYLHKGLKVVVTGRIQTGSYTNRDGQKVYTTDVVVEDQEFAESKSASDINAGSYSAGSYAGGYSGNPSGIPAAAPAGSAPASSGGAPAPEQASAEDGFMNIPDSLDEDLPFN